MVVVDLLIQLFFSLHCELNLCCVIGRSVFFMRLLSGCVFLHQVAVCCVTFNVMPNFSWFSSHRLIKGMQYDDTPKIVGTESLTCFTAACIPVFCLTMRLHYTGLRVAGGESCESQQMALK